MKFKVVVEFLSDWHVGSGTGRQGLIDSLIRRDDDDLPYVPAKSLVGILRSSAETVAYALDDGQDGGPWQMWVDWVFGDQPAVRSGPASQPPRPAHLSLGPARLSPAVRHHLRGSARARRTLTGLRPGVALDPETGVARPDMLRFVEVARGGLTLEAWGELDASEGVDVGPARHLLCAAAFLTRGIGGKRRRGLGECRVRIEGLELGSAPLCDIDPHPPVWDTPGPMAIPLGQSVGGDWVRIGLRVRARTPLVVAAETLGNVVQTMEVLPGRMLLPIVLKRLGNTDQLRVAVACGDMVVTDGHPEVAGQRARPLPRSFRIQKGQPSLLAGGAARDRLNELEAHWGEQWTKHPVCFAVAVGDGELACHRVRTQTVTHNVIDDALQRPTSDVGGVFSYRSIKAGEVFRADVLVRSRIAAHLGDGWAHTLAGPARLGRSRKDDYGSVEIELVEPTPTSAGALPAGTFTVLCDSDVVLCDHAGAPDPTPQRLVQELAAALGQPLELVADEFAIARDDSWQTRWGLPRPTLVTVARGSVMQVRSASEVSAEVRASVEAAGVGLRRAEGYGRVLLSPAEVKGLEWRAAALTQPQEDAGEPVEPSEADLDMIAELEFDGWRAEVLERAAVVATQPDRVIPKITTVGRSQLGALRSQVSASVAGARDWWQAMLEVQNRKERWYVDAQATITKLLDEGSEHVWRLLEYSPDDQPPDDLRDVALRALLTQVLARAARAEGRSRRQEQR